MSQRLTRPMVTGVPNGTAAMRRFLWRPEPSNCVAALLAAPLVLLLIALVVVPFVQLLIVAAGPPHGLQGNIRAYLNNRANLIALRITLVDSAVVTMVAVGLGTVLAWALRTVTNRPARLVMLLAIFVPVWMGSVVKLYAFTAILEGPGVLSLVLRTLHLTAKPVDLLYTQLAVVMGMVYELLPYSVLPLYAAFATIDLDLVAAAEGLGASRVRALLSVVLPLAVPAMLAAMIIVYVISIGFFITPVVLGGITTPFTATLIDQDLFSFYDFSSAVLSSIALLIAALIVVVAGYLAVGEERLRRAIA